MTYRITTDRATVEFDDRGNFYCRTCGYEETAQPDEIVEAGTALDAAREAARWHTTECDR